MADVNHRFMTPPYIRVVAERKTQTGDPVYLWDLRIGQPNVSHVAMPVLHSIEHFLGDYFRSHRTGVLNVGLMGCQTGFYISAVGIGDVTDMTALLADALAPISEATAVPLANATQCGWAENHSLAGAQELAAWLLRRRAEWSEVGSDAHEIH